MFGSNFATRGNRNHVSFSYDAEPILDYFSDIDEAADLPDTGPQDNGTVFLCRFHGVKETLTEHMAKK